jgi:hypothetical protein
MLAEYAPQLGRAVPTWTTGAWCKTDGLFIAIAGRSIICHYRPPRAQLGAQNRV